MKYEYTIVVAESVYWDTQDKLNKLGDGGWEMVSAVRSAAGDRIYMKRARPNPAPARERSERG